MIVRGPEPSCALGGIGRMPHSYCMKSASKFLRLSKLRRLRETEQVAAVCYRMRGADIEFLLVKTGGGRWIFPKGSVEPGLTHAQAAAIEAFEEAGVHGRIEEEAFATYRIQRPGKKTFGKQKVTAHLCEVLRLGPPQESGRNRTWFTVEKTKRRLGYDRSDKEGMELARVVSRAVVRIAQTRQKPVKAAESPIVHQTIPGEPLQKVQFETFMGQHQGQTDALYTRYIRRLRGTGELWEDDGLAGFLSKPRLQLGAVSALAVQKVTVIDQGRRYKAKN